MCFNETYERMEGERNSVANLNTEIHVNLFLTAHRHNMIGLYIHVHVCNRKHDSM